MMQLMYIYSLMYMCLSVNWFLNILHRWRSYSKQNLSWENLKLEVISNWDHKNILSAQIENVKHYYLWASINADCINNLHNPISTITQFLSARTGIVIIVWWISSIISTVGCHKGLPACIICSCSSQCIAWAPCWARGPPPPQPSRFHTHSTDTCHTHIRQGIKSQNIFYPYLPRIGRKNVSISKILQILVN